MKTILKGGTVVSKDGSCVMDICIENDIILKISENITESDANVVDVSGCLVFPGFIDAHTHLDMDTAVMHTADNFESGTKGAIAGGTTTVIDFATQNKGESLHEATENWHKLADGNSSCDYGFHMAITDWNEDVKKEISNMEDLGITSYKLYMAYDNLRVSDAEIFDILSCVKDVGGLVSMHCENGDLVNELVLKEKSQSSTDIYRHAKSRPSDVEAEAINRYLCIAKMADSPVYIVHVSSKQGLDRAIAGRKSGQEVYIESCPQYFLMDESKYKLDGFESAKYVLSPPLRTKIDMEALWESANKDEIDVIATDHCSFNYKTQKEFGKDDFSMIPSGLPGVEHRLALMYTYGVCADKMTVEQLVATMSENPAKLFGMYPKKGVIAVGSDADIVVWDPSESGKITVDDMYMNVDYTPYEGVEIKGLVKQVYLRGKLVVENGKIVQEKSGIYQKRGRYQAL